MQMTSYDTNSNSLPMTDYNMDQISKVYWTGEDLDKALRNADKYLARYSKTDGTYKFFLCEECKGPKLGHKDDDCKGMIWSKEDLTFINDMIMNSLAFEPKFGLVKGNDDLVRKRTPKVVKPENIPVVEVFNVDVETKKAEIKAAADKELANIRNLINSMDAETEKQTIGMLRSQIAQIEMMTAKAMLDFEVSANAVLGTGASGGGGAGVKIEKQRVCPGWTEFSRYEHFRKQVENWDAKNTHDET